MTKNKSKEAYNVINRIAKFNGKTPFKDYESFELKENEEKKEELIENNVIFYNKNF